MAISGSSSNSFLNNLVSSSVIAQLSAHENSQLKQYLSLASTKYWSEMATGNMTKVNAFVKSSEYEIKHMISHWIDKNSPHSIESSKPLQISEDKSSGIVGTLVAENGFDKTMAVTWSIVGGKDAAAFSISSAGILSVKSALDHDTTPVAHVQVKATDSFGHFYEKTLSVNVKSIDKPTDIKLQAAPFQLDNHSIAHSVVGTLTTLDADKDTTFTYKVLNNKDFIVNHGVLETTKELSIGNHDVRVSSTSSEGLSIVREFDIQVYKAVSLPTDITLSSTKVAENTPSGTIATLSTVDSDSQAQFTYSIAGGKDAADFSLTGNQLVALHPFYYQATPTKEVIIKTMDQFGDSYVKTVNISVIDQAPTSLVLNANGTVYSNVSAGTLVGTLHGVDPDPQATLHYNVSGQDAALFAVDVNGNLTLTSSPGWNSGIDRQFDATVSDTSGLSLTQHFQFHAQGVAPSDIELSTTAIPDGLKAGSLVANLSSIGADPTDVVSWSISGTDAGKFTIVGQTLVATQDISIAKTGATDSITIRGTEKDGNYHDQNFTLSVTPAQSTGGILTGLGLSDYSVSEGLPVNHTVASVLTNGTTGLVALSIVGGNDAAQFHLDGNHLVLNNTEYNYSNPLLSVTVQGTDTSGHTVTQNFSINVLPATYVSGSGDVFSTGNSVSVFMPDPNSGLMNIHSFNEPQHDQIGMFFMFTQDQMNISNIRMTGVDDSLVHVQAHLATGWSDVAVLTNAVSSDGTLNGQGVADPLTQARLDSLTQSWLSNHTIHS